MRKINCSGNVVAFIIQYTFRTALRVNVLPLRELITLASDMKSLEVGSIGIVILFGKTFARETFANFDLFRESLTCENLKSFIRKSLSR